MKARPLLAAIGAPLVGGRALTLLAVVELGRGLVPVDAPVLHADDEGAAARPRGLRDAPRLRRHALPARRASRPASRGSAERVGLPEPDRAEFTAAAAAAVDAVGPSRISCCGCSGRRGARAAAGRPGFALRPRCRTGSTSCARAGFGSRSSSGRRAALAGAKSTSYAANMAAQAEARTARRRRRAARRSGRDSCSRRRPRTSGGARATAC